MTTGLAVNAAGTMVAANAAEYGTYDFKLISYVFVVRAEDGGYVSDVQKIDHGSANDISDYGGVLSSGMYFDPYGLVYLAHGFMGT